MLSPPLVYYDDNNSGIIDKIVLPLKMIQSSMRKNKLICFVGFLQRPKIYPIEPTQIIQFPIVGT